MVLEPKHQRTPKTTNTTQDRDWETTCAQIMTLPLIATVFGEVSLISIIANMLILPLIPLAMLLTFIAGIFGMTLASIAGWFAWPAQLILSFITNLISLLASVSWALISVKLSWVQCLTIITTIVVLTYVLRMRTNFKDTQAILD